MKLLDLLLLGYHADTLITTKAEAIPPGPNLIAILINIHEPLI